jgi:hypothetical protein
VTSQGEATRKGSYFHACKFAYANALATSLRYRQQWRKFRGEAEFMDAVRALIRERVSKIRTVFAKIDNY